MPKARQSVRNRLFAHAILQARFHFLFSLFCSHG
jgi:hypothetical protein